MGDLSVHRERGTARPHHEVVHDEHLVVFPLSEPAHVALADDRARRQHGNVDARCRVHAGDRLRKWARH